MSVWGTNVWGANVWGANVWGDATPPPAYSYGLSKILIAGLGEEELGDEEVSEE